MLPQMNEKNANEENEVIVAPMLQRGSNADAPEPRVGWDAMTDQSTELPIGLDQSPPAAAIGSVDFCRYHPRVGLV